MEQYLDLMRRVRDTGVKKTDRTGTGTLSVFGHQMRFDLGRGFPLVTTKRLHVRSIIHELIWFLSGETNTAYLKANKVTIWDEWAKDDGLEDGCGELGPVYGKQWLHWSVPSHSKLDEISDAVFRFRKSGDKSELDTIDQAVVAARNDGINQVRDAVSLLRRDPDSRRIIVSAWNPADIPAMALAPCHCLFQFNTRLVDGVRYLDCQLYQRSADIFLGVPFNIASYALLTMMMAQVTGMKPGEFIHTFGDAHLYLNHLEQVELQLSRAPRPLPTMRIDAGVTDIFRFRDKDFEISGYDPHPHIKAPVAI